MTESIPVLYDFFGVYSRIVRTETKVKNGVMAAEGEFLKCLSLPSATGPPWTTRKTMLLPFGAETKSCPLDGGNSILSESGRINRRVGLKKNNLR
jgi:hypothetical protein